MRVTRLSFVLAAFVAAFVAALAPPSEAAEDRVAAVEFPPVEVIGTTPLPGLGLPLARVPGNVQRFDAETRARGRHGTVADLLDESAASVNTNAASGNPSQLDLSYRGFAASPLLGTAQGLSVFVDGVRVNEPFGDVINWDLVPSEALADVLLVPGSNPIYGLNTLGGALVLTTKNGADFSGTTAQLTGGSFGRRAANAEYGGSSGVLDWYVDGNAADESGFREHSTSRLRQAFGKMRYRGASTSADLSANLAESRLEGTQALPASMLDAPQRAYTWPDITRNRLAAATARLRHDLGAAGAVAAEVYWRRLASRSFNSNVTGGGSDDAAPATNVDSTIHTTGWGTAVQWSGVAHAGSVEHRLGIGVAADLGTTEFAQTNQAAAITPERETVGIAAPAPGAAAHTEVRQLGIYGVDGIALTDRLSMLLALRYQTARLAIDDRSGEAPAIDGTHRFARLNPAAGWTYALDARDSLYANWSEGLRVPTAMELTCADPGAPCSLPNIFVSDPPLKAVVATTLEAGARGHWRRGDRVDATWNASVFRTALRNDIQFIATGGAAANAGYFANVGQTSRTGVELGASVPFGAMRLTGRYAYIRAVYDSDFIAHSPANIVASDTGDILVRRGDRLPGIPAHTFKLRARWQANESWDLAATLVAAARQYARGNENNADPSGVAPGYALLHLDATWRVAPQWELALTMANVLDRRYRTFGTLAENLFRGPNHTYAPALRAAEPFFGPGPPRAAWLSVRYAFGART